MRKLTVFLMMFLFILSSVGFSQTSTRKVFAFYYPWYGERPGGYDHWEENNATPETGDIASMFYPVLGPYNSADTGVIAQHMLWMKNAGIDVIIVSWWGENSYGDLRLKQDGNILDQANAQGLKVCFIIEPHLPSMSVDTYINDIIYLNNEYKNHPAFYKVSRSTYGNPNGAQLIRGVFFIFGTENIEDSEWTYKLDPNSVNTIRNTVNDSIVLQKVNNGSNVNPGINKLLAGHYDGLYTYKGETDLVTTIFDDLSTSIENTYNSIFCIGVSPGYDDRRVKDVDWQVNEREEYGVNLYQQNWEYAINSDASWAAIVTFNEWHEGTQVEPAIYNPPYRAFLQYKTYEGAFGKSGINSETAYITGIPVQRANYFKQNTCVTPTVPNIISPKNNNFTNTLHPTFVWDPVNTYPPVSNYQIRIYRNDGLVVLSATNVNNVTQWQLPFDLEFNKTYYWQIRAENQCGYGNWSANAYFKTPQLPYAPSIIYPKGGTTIPTTETFQWEAVNVTPAVDSYQIQVFRASDNEKIRDRTVGTRTNTTFTLPGDTRYYWRVRAHNSKGWGPYSDNKRFKTI
jgi:glycoprotein endo-alpha-1,2-mannosidase